MIYYKERKEHELFCLENLIRDLSQYKPWIDLETVNIRYNLHHINTRKANSDIPVH